MKVDGNKRAEEEITLEWLWVKKKETESCAAAQA